MTPQEQLDKAIAHHALSLALPATAADVMYSACLTIVAQNCYEHAEICKKAADLFKEMVCHHPHAPQKLKDAHAAVEAEKSTS